MAESAGVTSAKEVGKEEGGEVSAGATAGASAVPLDARASAALREQMEFYLGDANLRRDAFLIAALEDAQGGAETAEEERGWLDCTLFLKFNKVAGMTGDVGEVARAVAGSESLEVRGEGAGAQVRRRGNAKARNLSREEIDARTVFATGYARGSDHESLKALFGAVGKVTIVSMPRHADTHAFKGFAFVEFETPEEAERAAAQLDESKEAKARWLREQGRVPQEAGEKKDGDEVGEKKDGDEVGEKKDGDEAGGKKDGDEADGGGGGSKAGGVGDGASPPRKNHWEVLKVLTMAEWVSERRAKKSGGKGGGKRKRGDEHDIEGNDAHASGFTRTNLDDFLPPVTAENVQFEPGTVLKFSGAGGSTTRHGIKQAIRGLEVGDSLRFIQYVDGEAEGFARFNDPAKAASLAGTSEPLGVGEGVQLTFTKVEGDEERAYFVRMENEKRESAKRPRRGGGGGSRGRGGGGRGRGHKGGRGGHRD